MVECTETGVLFRAKMIAPVANLALAQIAIGITCLGDAASTFALADMAGMYSQ